MRALLHYAPLLKREQGTTLLAIVLSIVTLAAGIALLGLSGWFLTAASLTTMGAAFNLFGPSAAVRGLSFVRILSRYGERLSGHGATLRLLAHLRQWLFAKLFPIVPLREFGRSDLVSRMVSDIDALDTVFLLALGPITTAILAGLAMTIGLWLFLPSAAGIYAAASAGAVVAIPLILLQATRRTGAAALEAASDLRRVSLDAIDGHQDLVLFGALERTRDKASEATRRVTVARRRLGTSAALASGLTQLCAGAALIGTLYVGLQSMDAGAIDGPLLAGIVLAVAASFEASAMLVRSTTRLATAAAAAERLQVLVDQPQATIEPASPVVPTPRGGIAFHDVSFGFDPERPVLAGLSFSIRHGECVAITGASGSGKSTIAQLMARLVDPQEGAVTLNAVDLRRVASEVLHSRVSLMTQDAPVFLDSVRANLLIGNPTSSDAQLWQALATVGLATFVSGLPSQLDSLLGEAGRTLSVGQARRICLARSLLSHASVLILDEPTSGLDAEAAAAFLEDLPRIAGGRTMVVITHANLPSEGFDRVLRLRAGRLETGMAACESAAVCGAAGA